MAFKELSNRTNSTHSKGVKVVNDQIVINAKISTKQSLLKRILSSFSKFFNQIIKRQSPTGINTLFMDHPKNGKERGIGDKVNKTMQQGSGGTGSKGENAD